MNRVVILYMWAAAALLPGCVFYTSSDDDCEYGVGADQGIESLRDPATGQCQSLGGPRGGERCAVVIPAADPAAVDWGVCTGACTGLDEATCLGTPACRAAYVDDCTPDLPCLPGAGLTFHECWAVAPSGPVGGGGCTGLDAYTCSQHDDCAAVHQPGGQAGAAAEAPPGLVDTIGDFSYCTAEPIGCFGEGECPAGSTCNAAEVCLPPPNPGGQGQDAACYGFCVPDREPTSLCFIQHPEAAFCDEAAPDCPAGTLPANDGGCWTGECIPRDQCPEGSCHGEVLCDIIQPSCPAGLVPGVADGCYTGLCIPMDECEAPAACDQLGEVGCIGRADCAPYYEGVDCTCAAGGCDCADWSFVGCAALAQPPG